jgi:transcriptional regulator with PAS, ATPase and Fis domain
MQIGIIVSDAEGILVYINETYARFLNIRIKDSIGKHATEVISNTRLHIVARTGQAEINYPHKFKEIGYLVHRIPIKKNGRIVAVLGLVLFDSATTAVKLAEKLVYLESKLKFAQSELASLYATRYTFDDIIGDSLAMRSLKEEAISAAHNDLPVLITGESGTGKELFAQAIHRESARRAYPFVRVNCAAIPKELFESELFGYEKGAFSGAGPKGKAGKFELAHMGTIFLDEIGDMPLELQPKLLRVLELKEFERVGGNKLISSDFRVITATNQNLEQWMEFGRFRRDLYYRLNCIPLDIRPLRTRREDIACLADYLLQRIAGQGQGGKKSISPEAYKLMERYSWPGNGRELLHVLERTVFSMTGSTIAPPDLPDYLQLPMPSAPQIEKGTTLKAYLRTAEKFAIEHALADANQNKTIAAKMLGIHRTLLYRKMQLLGLSHKIKDD